MKVAVISDIHGNLEALERVFRDIDRRNDDGQKIEEILCLGDVVGYGPNPRECLDLVRRRCTVVLAGNHELGLVEKVKTPRLGLGRSTGFGGLGAREGILWAIHQLYGESSPVNSDDTTTREMIERLRAPDYEPTLVQELCTRLELGPDFKMPLTQRLLKAQTEITRQLLAKLLASPSVRALLEEFHRKTRARREGEEHVAYLAQVTDKTTIVNTMRVAWRTVGAIAARVVDRHRPGDPLDGLTHIGVDELSFRKHHSYVTVVIDHVNERVVWARRGKSAETLGEFFKDLGPERSEKLESVTMGMSPAYIAAVKAAVPEVQVIFDRFHVQRLAHDALDEVRRAEVRASESIEEGRALKRTRFILHKNPWNLTNLENQKLTEVRRVNGPIYRAYLLKETLAAILDGRQVNVARAKLAEWVSWAAHSHLKPFEKLARTVNEHSEGILAYVQTRLSNGRTEGMNGKIRTITRRSYGFHSAENLIALIYLCCSGITLVPVLKLAQATRRTTPRP